MITVFFGLGNPGEQYENTRHNFGRMCLQAYLNTNNLSWQNFNEHGEFAKLTKEDNIFYFLRTTTLFMNQSGIFLREFMDFYKLNASDCIIVYDEMDYNLGQIKLKETGASAGHNGMKDIFLNLNTQNIKRIRLGIGRPKNDKRNYVLGRFSANEKSIVEQVIKKIVAEIIPFYMESGKFSLLMNKFNK